MPDDTIVIKAPPGTKARWVRQSQLDGQKLSDWLISRVDATTAAQTVCSASQKMTSEQFSALAALMSQPASKSAAAARLVLVDGLSSAEAARRVGITTQGANQSVKRCRRVIELAQVVVR